MMPEGSSSKGDHRIFVGAFIEGELSERIQALRLQYDPVTARISHPHVTLAGLYWRNGPATPENEAETIRRLDILSGLAPSFDLLLQGVHTYPGKRPVVHLNVLINEGIIEARNLLLSVLGPDKHRHFRPHLTLAMRLPWFEAWSMVSELQETEWNTQQQAAPITTLRLMQRGQDDSSWRCIHRIELVQR